VYSITEFAKSHTAVEDLAKIEEDIATRLKETREISERNDALQVCSDIVAT